MSVDDDRDMVREAEKVARELAVKDAAEKLAAMRERVVERFFGESGIPDHLKEGWAIFDKNREIRAKVGHPLPPGGVLLLGINAVVAGCLAEMHTALADMLQVSIDNIRMRIERTPEGHLNPVADIDVPSDWLLPIAKDPRSAPEEAAKAYLNHCIEVAQAHFRVSVTKRLATVNTKRSEAAQPVESFA